MVIPEYQSVDAQRWEKEVMLPILAADSSPKEEKISDGATQASKSMTRGPS